MIIFGENVFTHDSARFPNPHERRDDANIRFLKPGEGMLHKLRNAVNLGAADLIRAADLKWIKRIKAADARSVEREFAMPSIHAEQLKIAEVIFFEDSIRNRLAYQLPHGAFFSLAVTHFDVIRGVHTQER